jgi:cytosine/adenosine deaminase-related metal-dependent hydrolase
MNAKAESPTPTIADVVDHLDAIKAGVATMRNAEEEDKARLIDAAASSGLRAFEGTLYRATVSFGDRQVTDWRKVVQELCEIYSITDRTLDFVVGKHTETCEGLPVVRVTARKSGG